MERQYEFGREYLTIHDEVYKCIGHKIENKEYIFIDESQVIRYVAEDSVDSYFKCVVGEYPRLYVLVNNRLSTVYGCVQGGHAVAQYMIDNPDQTWGNQYLIYLHADTKYWAEELAKMGVPHSVWREPDMEDFVTAIACRDDSGKLFEKLSVVR